MLATVNGMIVPPLLTKNDTVSIVAPSKYIESSDIEYAISVLTQWGLKVVLGKNLYNRNKYFSGTTKERIEDLQWAINNKEIKAIFCARGGYGASKIVDIIDYKPLIKSPKWVIGFSDITIFHLHLSMLNISSIHGNMPALFKSRATKDSLLSIKGFLFEKNNAYHFKNNLVENNIRCKNITGKCEGIVVGGNLSMICHALGSKTKPTYKDIILFIEDVDEYYYAIDRYLNQIQRAGILQQIRGLVIGSFNHIKEDDTYPFQKSLSQIFSSYFLSLNIPVAYGFSAGHIENNLALGFGLSTNLTVRQEDATLTFRIN